MHRHHHNSSNRSNSMLLLQQWDHLSTFGHLISGIIIRAICRIATGVSRPSIRARLRATVFPQMAALAVQKGRNDSIPCDDDDDDDCDGAIDGDDDDSYIVYNRKVNRF